MILHNANVITMDERLPHASALAIAGGKVLGGVDSREDAIASHAHEHVDLRGATVAPGFVDAHVHFRRWAAGRAQVDLRECRTRDELLARVREAAAAGGPDGQRLVGHGWRDELVRELDDPAAVLREAAGGREVALISKDGHALWLASERGPSGVVRETRAWELRRDLQLDEPSLPEMAAAMREAARRGVTCVHDMDGAAGLRTWRQLERERGLSLRVCQFLLERDVEAAAHLGMDEGFGSERLWIGGVKLFADGTLGSGTAWLLDPELDPRPAGDGDPVRSGEQLIDAERIARAAAAAPSLPLAVHAIGDAAAQLATRALAALPPRPASHRIEHAQLMHPDDIRTCAEHGIALSLQPTHLLDDRPLVDRHWADRAERAFALRSMLDAGAVVLLGSDAPIEDLDPLAALRTAVARDGWHPEQCIAPADALRACTSAPYDASAPGRRLGRLTPGCEADLVVLSADPLTAPLDEVQVLATMVGGRWTHGAANLG